MSSEQSTLNQRPSQWPDRDRSPAHHPERFGLGANETAVHQTLFPDSQALSASIEDQGINEEDGILPTGAQRHDSGQERSGRSEDSTRMHPAQSHEGGSAGRERRRERERERHSTATYNYGAGASAHSGDDSNLPPKQYTKFWYCHRNCHQPGPWRSEVPRCIGCEHNRCAQCEEETVVTRDPSAPRR